MRIADLDRRITGLSEYMDAHLLSFDLAGYVRLLHLHGQLTSRLGHLLRDQHALTGDGGEELAAAISMALDELGKDLGVEI